MIRRRISSALAGAGAGLFIFAREGRLILETESGPLAGVKVDLHGPMATIAAAIQPVLPSLIFRIGLAYALGGLVIGLAAGVLAELVTGPGRGGWRSDWRWALLLPLEWGGLAAVITWWKVVHRPALIDDLPSLRPALIWIVDHGEPWHPVVAAALLLAVHLLFAARRVAWAALPNAARGLGPRTLKASGAVAVLIALVWLGGRAAEQPKHPLVVLIGVDAFRPDRLAALGGRAGDAAVAPNIDAFVAGATLFERAYTPIAQTEPAWRSLLTARWPHRTGVRFALTADGDVTPAPTFPGALAKAGYQTAFFTDCSRFHFETEASGFEERLQPPRGGVNFLLEKLRFRGIGVVADHALGAWLLPEMVENRALAGVYDPIAYAERMADGWVERARRGPALLAYHAVAVHFPGDPVYPYYRQRVGAAEPLERRLRMVFAPIGTVARAEPGKSAWTREGSEALYDELLSEADAQVGLLLGALREAGLYDEATIILFSDHGESFHADYPALAGATPVHGSRLQEVENRILLAVKLPRQREPKRVDALVRLIDIGPTVLELSHQPALPDADGESLLPLLDGAARSPRLLYAETGFTHAAPEAFQPGHQPGAPRVFDSYAVRSDGVIQMTEEAKQAALREKDLGAFDGEHWLIRSPRLDGSVAERCTGHCEALAAWLNRVGPPSAAAPSATSSAGVPVAHP